MTHLETGLRELHRGEHSLASLLKSCRPGTVRQMRWAEAALKESAAQIMLSE
ncbi:hypothetical protein ACFQS3_10150 [Glycomyces mayteni]|uniref:Transposase n=1 Tax=Glycomyces mayteni TaxID=543887 RepID=A0ABW2D977_9ACTN|nr:hypothetical protein GCM10025732_30260 [Glycomyces mayteni]